jgi:hypothetical protein
MRSAELRYAVSAPLSTIKNPHHFVVRVVLLVEAAGIKFKCNLLLLLRFFKKYGFTVTSNVTLT